MTSIARELERTVVLGDRYTLIRPIATGGMAEIFLARQKALAGFEKEVVVKLLRDRYRSDPRVVEMFMNEARIGAVLAHPNVVHVYDVGEHDKQPYLVLEHIDGDELSNLCRRGLELAKFLPLEHAVDLMRQAAEALGYVHSRKGGDRPLEIVHRDISPSNFIVTRDGVLKIIDFGIARASWPGKKDAEDKLVPGKYNYMSPEQVRGERVDARSDIFSLGIVLYELTVGKRLFKGRPEEVIQKIVRGKIKPPTFVRQKFPPALEAIVMRALEPHREDRYLTAYALANDLEEFLRTASLKSGPVRIAQYLDELRAAEGGERRPELVIAGEAWLDDDGEEALDFERGFSAAAARPEVKPVEKLIEKLEAKAPASSLAPPSFDEEEGRTAVVDEPMARTADLGPGPRAGADDIDADLGEDIPTDASMTIPEVDPSDPAARDMTARMQLAEPTGRVSLLAVTGKVTRVPGVAMPIVEARKPGQTMPLAAPASASTDASSSIDTPLPAPMVIEETTRYPYAKPLREHLQTGGSLKVVAAPSDSMSMTIPAELKPATPERPRRGRAKTKKKPTRNFRPRAAGSLAPAADPAPAAAFGDGILAIHKKRALPWPVIGGAAAFVILLAFLLIR